MRPLLVGLLLVPTLPISSALAEPACTLITPAGWSAEAGRGAVLLVSREPESQVRDVRGTLELRKPASGTLDAAIAQAKAEAAKLLAGHPDLELVRDEPLPGGQLPGRFLVYHYRLPDGRHFGLRYQALVKTTRGIVPIVAESHAIYIDALHHPHFEAGAHERDLVASILSTRCR